MNVCGCFYELSLIQAKEKKKGFFERKSINFDHELKMWCIIKKRTEKEGESSWEMQEIFLYV